MSSTLRSRLVTVALLTSLAVGVVVMASTAVVRTTVLDEDTYIVALSDADVYERTYTEILADPEFAVVAEDLLGQVVFGPVTSVQARALATSSLRLSLPPEDLQQVTESSLSSVLAYVRGDVDDLRVEVAVDQLLTRVEVGTVARLNAVLADPRLDRVIDDSEQFALEVERFLDDLLRGVVPDEMPRLEVAQADVDRLREALAGPLHGVITDDELDRIEALLLAGADREAVVAAASVAIADHAGSVAAGLRADVADFDLNDSIGTRARGGAAAVAGSLDGPRRMAAWFSPLTAALASVVVAGSITVLVWRGRRAPGRTALLVGVGAIAGALATLAVWWAVRGSLADPLDRAVGSGPDGWNLPAGLRGVLADVRAGVGGSIGAQVWWRAAVPLVIGLVLVAVAVVAPRLGGLAATVRGPRVMAAGAGLSLVVAVGVVLATPDASDAEIVACNGHAELCDRPYDEVVYAATHNSMSSPDIVVVWPEHDGDMRSQLDAGVRALLIDTHYWTPVDSAAQLVELAPEMPPAVASLVLSTAGPAAQGRDGTFLCHNHCVFGGIDLVEGLGQVTGFLEANPSEVVTLIIQDAISVEDTEAAMQASGLADHLYTHRPGEPWPTLRDLIESGERLVVFAEEEGPPPDWYANAFEAMQETPFLALTPEALSCRPNRGDPDATLFLMNHWVQRIAPDRADSSVINQRDFIVERARECEAERGLMPNFVAVNFYSIGDVMGAVDELNGVG
ncbi:MAG: hypothetical protein ACXIVQ_05755 [Acidimicrobiales bacterium]